MTKSTVRHRARGRASRRRRRRHGPFHAAARAERICRAAASASAPRYPISDLAAIVTVTDDGGSSGRLRREYSVLPPGDIRNCMVALSKDEALLSHLFQYRFSGGQGLGGHSFRQFFSYRADARDRRFSRKRCRLSRTSAGHPRTDFSVDHAERLARGGVGRRHRGARRNQNFAFDAADRSHAAGAGKCAARCRKCCRPLREANLILLGPGSLYTSLIPNLLTRASDGSHCEFARLREFISRI